MRQRRRRLTLLPLASHRSPRLQDNQTAALFKQLARASYAGMTGANLIWTAENVLFRGILSGNRSEAAAAAAACAHEVVLAPGTAEGMKADGSFFQHGNQLYNGGYGQSFAYDVAALLALTAGTPLAFPQAQVDLFGSWLVQGSLRMLVYRATPMWDLSVVGRDVTRPYGSSLQFGFGQSGQQVSFVSAALSGIGGAAAALLDIYAAALNGSVVGPPAVALGHTHFYQSDYAICTHANWTASVRMQSTRTLRSECVNDEGVRSLHLADGAAFLYVNGNEYKDIAPAWDWEKLPGTVVRAGAAPLACNDVQGVGLSPVTGGTGDGDSGMAMQRFIAPVRQNLTLDRLHAFFARALPVRLANITAASTTYATIDSRLIDGDVWAGTVAAPVASARKLAVPGNFSWAAGAPDAPGWLWHAGVGYVATPPPSPGAALRLTLAPAATGSWASIGQAISYGNATVPLATLWFEFGAPDHATAQYVVVPAIALADFQSALAASGADAFASATGGTDWSSAAGTCAPAGAAGDASPCAALALFAAGATADVPASAGFPAFSASAGAAPAALLFTLGVTALRVAGSSPAQQAWTATVRLTQTPLVAAAGPGWACAADGTIAFTAPPANGSSLIFSCDRA